MADPPGNLKKILPDAATRPADKALPATPGTATDQCIIDNDSSRFGEEWFTSTMVADDATTYLPEFADILEEHNRRLPQIAGIRSAVQQRARAELTAHPDGNFPEGSLLKTIFDLYASAMAAAPPPYAPIEFTPEQLVGLLETNPGHSRAFDPWTDWWAGEFISVGTHYFNLHVWDPTVAVTLAGKTQYVQPVTQVEAPGQWFGSARRLLEEPAARLPLSGKQSMTPVRSVKGIDFALNVWSPDDAITGYVVKKLGTSSAESLPHAGFLIEDNCLLWCAAIETKGGAAIGQPFSVLMFIETGFANGTASGEYAIRGARLADVTWISATAINLSGSFIEVKKHTGDYQSVIHVRDSGSLDCAIRTKALGGMAQSFAEKVITKAR